MFRGIKPNSDQAGFPDQWWMSCDLMHIEKQLIFLCGGGGWGLPSSSTESKLIWQDKTLWSWSTNYCRRQRAAFDKICLICVKAKRNNKEWNFALFTFMESPPSTLSVVFLFHIRPVQAAWWWEWGFSLNPHWTLQCILPCSFPGYIRGPQGLKTWTSNYWGYKRPDMSSQRLPPRNKNVGPWYWTPIKFCPENMSSMVVVAIGNHWVMKTTDEFETCAKAKNKLKELFVEHNLLMGGCSKFQLVWSHTNEIFPKIAKILHWIFLDFDVFCHVRVWRMHAWN